MVLCNASVRQDKERFRGKKLNSLGRKEKENKSSVFTRETLGVVVMLFSTLCLVCLITREHVFYDFGRIINAFLLGCFGYFAFLLLAGLEILGFLLCSGKKLPFTKKFKVLFTLTMCLIALLGQIISLQSGEFSYGEYLGECFTLAGVGLKGSTAGGLFSGLIAYPINALLSNVGSYVVLSVAIVITGYFLIKEKMHGEKTTNKDASSSKFRSSFAPKKVEQIPGVNIEGEMEYPVIGAVPAPEKIQNNQKLFVMNADDFSVKSKREMNKGEDQSIVLNQANGGLYVGGYAEPIKPAQTVKPTTPSYSDEMARKLEYIKTPPKINVDRTVSEMPITPSYGTSLSNNIPLRKSEPTVEQPIESEKEVENTDIPMYFHDESKPVSEEENYNITARSNARDFGRYADIEEVNEDEVKEEVSTEIYTPIEPIRHAEPEVVTDEPAFEQSEEIETYTDYTPIEETRKEIENVENIEEEIEETPAPSIIRDRRCKSLFGEDAEIKSEEQASAVPDEKVTRGFERLASLRQSSRAIPEQPVEEPKEEQKPPKEIPPINRVYNAPPLDLLEPKRPRSLEQEDHNGRLEIICRTLENFSIPAEPAGHIQGPTVTRYEIRMPGHVSVKRVTGYGDDLKMRLSSPHDVRIQAPIPGKDLVGIEVSNKYPDTVGLRELLEESAGKPSKPGSLMFAIGKDIVGNVIMDNLADGPHYLVAGTTGSGKSVCLNIMIISMIMRYSPEDLRLILVDPKGIEFSPYLNIPHLMINEIVIDSKRAVAVLQWACVEMERRFKLFRDCGHAVRNIEGYNEIVASDTIPRLPRVVIVVDELSNLMETNKKEMEARILSISQKARAAGIHLVLATQRPSVDVITGTIKNNLPSRIALKLSVATDSATILGEGGAEKLLGHGDMLYRNSLMSDSVRYQGAFISDREKTNIIDYIIEHNKAYFDDDLKEFLDKSDREAQEKEQAQMPSEDSSNENYENRVLEDPLFKKALAVAVTDGQVSTSSIQRRFRIGYNRAASLVDEMASLNFLSANEGGNRGRRVLITIEQFEEEFGPIDNYR